MLAVIDLALFQYRLMPSLIGHRPVTLIDRRTCLNQMTGSAADRGGEDA
jgi:hypothetical protein